MTTLISSAAMRGLRVVCLQWHRWAYAYRRWPQYAAHIEALKLENLQRLAQQRAAHTPKEPR